MPLNNLATQQVTWCNEPHQAVKTFYPVSLITLDFCRDCPKCLMLLILLSNLFAGSVHCASVNEISKEYKSKFTNAEWDGNPTACVVKPYCYSHQKSNFMSTLKKENKEKMLQLRAPL